MANFTSIAAGRPVARSLRREATTDTVIAQ
jgi:hypothetical protein